MPVFSTRGGNKGAHGRFLNDYRTLVDRLLASKPRDEAMLVAIGGNDNYGDLEFALLDRFGLGENGYLIDVGCGSGRLARRVARLPQVKYLGTDINQKLLQYAKETAGRPDFRFQEVDSTFIPEGDGVADMVVFFSVGTHMLNEEFFIYLQDAARVLKSKGRIIFSFLDLQIPGTQTLFGDMVQVVRGGSALTHLNVFIGRGDISVWANMLGMDLVALIPGDAPFPEASERALTLLGRPIAGEMLGQSTAVLEKR
jgi:SAM-dependent methyltransferase